MKVDTDDLVTATDISTIMGVRQSAVANWVSRHSDFPACVFQSKGTKLWRWSEVAIWLNMTGRFGTLGTAIEGTLVRCLKCGKPFLTKFAVQDYCAEHRKAES